MSISLDCIRVGMLETNCYLVSNDETKEAIITDPGDNAAFIAQCVEEKGVKPVAVFLTHAHADHILALEEIREKYDIPVYVNEADEDMLQDGYKNLGMVEIHLTEKDVKLKGGEELSVGGMKIQVLHTPGHTPGGTCYYFPEAGFVLAGDTMFFRSWGRTDFPGGDERALMKSIQTKLLPLPEETLVYPGHMQATTIQGERRMHGFVQ
ncbi:MAG: MBL fold metallo-hydrolase [Lachnospiraceae bacterium]|nr:MBL fold metallo-hydrolase [Lachnospiraceae bacterium]